MGGPHLLDRSGTKHVCLHCGAARADLHEVVDAASPSAQALPAAVFPSAESSQPFPAQLAMTLQPAYYPNALPAS